MSKKIRMTKQKRVILDILKETDLHPTAAWVYQEAKKQIPDLSLGTVYRNLNLLKETGAILELTFGSVQSRYDGNPEQHYHFICRNCKQIYDLHLPLYSLLEDLLAEEYGHQCDDHRLEFYGLCESCRLSNREN